MGSDIRDAAVPYASPLPDVRTAYDDGAGWSLVENSASGRSVAGTGMKEDDGSNAIFVLSLSEVNEWLPTANRVGYGVGTTTGYIWWLRSPGNQATYVARITSVGAVHTYGAGYSYGYRPALWVNSES
jgi:hypothetical protein